MQFDQFVRLIDAAIRESTTVDRSAGPQKGDVRWSARGRTAAMALVPPLNVSVSLDDGPDGGGTTWYPIDQKLVPVVSRRIARFLSEA